MSIYVETLIRGSMDELWRRTQTPELHVRWDLRFSDIEYLPRASESEPQLFRYATRIGFGLHIEGRGETVGQRDLPDGERVSALKFWSDDPKSLIREGAGYWRYLPQSDGIRFFTSYDYRVRFGVLGRLFDALVFRPLIGWGTAWSFDRLRLWIERGIDPAVSLERSVIHAIARCTVAAVWMYHGIVPKLWRPHPDELAMMIASGVPESTAPAALQLAGWAETLFGLAILVLFAHRWPLWATIALMLAALLGVAVHSPAYLTAAFNPVSLNLQMIALSVVGLWTNRDLPSARRCLRRPPGGGR